MDADEFRKNGTEMVEYIANYMENVHKRRVYPDVEPGYLQKLIPTEAPSNPEKWDAIMTDVEEKILPGVTHWQHPSFHAYFPSGNSYPSILGDMLSDGLGVIGFSWASSPACTELEVIVLDWIGKLLDLPQSFISNGENSRGGGVIQGSASECMMVTLLAARMDKIKQLQLTNPMLTEEEILPKLVAYCSKDAHSCIEKAAMVSFIQLRKLEPDDVRSMRGKTLKEALEDDIADGLIPFYVEATLGTTSCCSFDNIYEIGLICEQMNLWLHVDGAYGGNSFICPELRSPMKGMEYASSFNINPNKFLLTNFDCSILWVKDKHRFTEGFIVDPLYLQHSETNETVDYRHWGLSLSRRFRALKLWFVIRSFGSEGLRKYIRNHCRLAEYFASLVGEDDMFEISSPVHLGLVCFRMKSSNYYNDKLLSSINKSGKLHLTPATIGEQFIIRFCVCAQNAVVSDIDYAWDVIKDFASQIQYQLHIQQNHIHFSSSLVNEEERDRKKRFLVRSKRLSVPNFKNGKTLRERYRRDSLNILFAQTLGEFVRNWTEKVDEEKDELSESDSRQ